MKRVLVGQNCITANRHEIRARRHLPRTIQSDEGGAQASATTVTSNRSRGLSRNGERHLDHLRAIRRVHDKNPLTPGAPTTLTKDREGLTSTDAGDHAEMRARPLRRRVRRMARPALVDIRLRKPCFLERLRTFG